MSTSSLVPAQRAAAPRPRLLVVQHASFAGPGLAAEVWRRAGLALDVVHVAEGAAVPTTPGDAAGVVVLGGPQAAFEDDAFPSRYAELALLAGAVEAGLPVLGICLGAQLLGVATGGVGYRGNRPETGWTPVAVLPAAVDDPVVGCLPRRCTVMQSHRDGVVPPPGSVVLASSAAYPVQAFRVGPRAWGLQFHLEAQEGFAGQRRRFVPGWGGGAAPDPAAEVAEEAAAVRALLPAATAVFARFGLLVRERAGLPPLRAAARSAV